MDPIKVDVQVAVRKNGPVVELFFLKRHGLETYVLVPTEVSEYGGIVWKEEKIPEGAQAPVSLHLSDDLYDALKEAVIEMVPAASEELIKTLKSQLAIEQARVNKLMDHGIR